MDANILNSKVLKVFIKGSLTLIGLFFVLSCVVAVLLFPFDKKLEVGKNAQITENSKTSKSSEIKKNTEVNKYSEANEYTKIVNNTGNGDNEQPDDGFNEQPDKNKICSLILVLVTPLVVLFLFFIIFYFSVLKKFYKEQDKLSQENEQNLKTRYNMDPLKEAYNLTVKGITSITEKKADILKETLPSITKNIAFSSENNETILKVLLSSIKEIYSGEEKNMEALKNLLPYNTINNRD